MPRLPARGFASLDEARAWGARFVHSYNVEHGHSGIGYVTPAQRAMRERITKSWQRAMPSTRTLIPPTHVVGPVRRET